ncbi:MAG: CpaD family pilus assembly protein [Parerythrobacter sp.]
MSISNTHGRSARKLAAALVFAGGLSLGACQNIMPANTSLYSVKQPVVERTNYTFDLPAGAGGLAISEQRRLAQWFDTMKLGYGDRVSIDDPMNATGTREAIASLTERHGVLVSEGAPVTAGYVEPGSVRVVVTRSSASVPGCPDWSAWSDANYRNETDPGYGCATNSNLAAMVANPEDLVAGQEGNGETTVTRSTRAVNLYREQALTGEGGLAATGTE